MEPAEYIVTVSFPGFGRFRGGTYDKVRKFTDRDKARDYYTDMIIRYPDYEITYDELY